MKSYLRFQRFSRPTSMDEYKTHVHHILDDDSTSISDVVSFPTSLWSWTPKLTIFQPHHQMMDITNIIQRHVGILVPYYTRHISRSTYSPRCSEGGSERDCGNPKRYALSVDQTRYNRFIMCLRVGIICNCITISTLYTVHMRYWE